MSVVTLRQGGCHTLAFALPPHHKSGCPILVPVLHKGGKPQKPARSLLLPLFFPFPPKPQPISSPNNPPHPENIPSKNQVSPPTVTNPPETVTRPPHSITHPPINIKDLPNNVKRANHLHQNQASPPPQKSGATQLRRITTEKRIIEE